MIVNYVNKYKNTLLTLYPKNKPIQLSKKRKEYPPKKNILLNSNNRYDKYNKNFNNYNKIKTKSISISNSNKANSPLIKSNLIIFERKKINNKNLRHNYIFENTNETRKINRGRSSNNRSSNNNSELVDSLIPNMKMNKKKISNKGFFSPDDYNNIFSISNLCSYRNIHVEIPSSKNNKKYLSPQKKAERYSVKFTSKNNINQNNGNVTTNRFKYYDNQLPYINKTKSKKKVKIQKKLLHEFSHNNLISTNSNNNIDVNANNSLSNKYIKINRCNSNISNASKKNNLLFKKKKEKTISVNLINHTTINYNKEIPMNTTNSEIWNNNIIISQSKIGSSLGYGSNNNTKSNFFITSDRRSQDHISRSMNNTVVKGKNCVISPRKDDSINKYRRYSCLKLLNSNVKNKPKYLFKNQFKDKLFKASMTCYKEQFFLNKIKNSSEKNINVLLNLSNTSNNISFLLNSSRNSDKLSIYEIKQTLGKGAYAIVKLAINKKTREKLAIKVYDKSKLNDNFKKRCVMREIEIMKHIDHPNIVKLIEVINTDKQIYIIQELVTGISLRDYYNKEIRYQKGISEHKEILFKKIFRQIFDAMNYLHSNHMAHRDIKLENILITEKYEIKIIDFGFGMYNPENKLQTFFCGTPNYMPPEIILKKPYIGQKADLWSLGVLVYKMYCADFPFRGRNEKELYFAIKSCKYEIIDYVPEYTKCIIKSMIQFNPDERLTCKEILKSSWLID